MTIQRKRASEPSNVIQLRPDQAQTEATVQAKASKTSAAKKTNRAKEIAPDALDDAGKKLLEASKRGDVKGIANVVSAWIGAQKDVNAALDAVHALSNFLRKFGAAEENPTLYPKIFEADPAKFFQNDNLLDHFGPLLDGIAKAHSAGKIDIMSTEFSAARGLLEADNSGLMTDALKVKMTAWSMLTEQLKSSVVTFEQGIRKLPGNPNTNFLIIDGMGAAAEWVKSFRISPQAVKWMSEQATFKGYPKEVFDYFMPPADANGLRKKGELSQFEKDIRACKIEAIPDGEVYVGGPMLRVKGPPQVAEYLETNLMRFATARSTVATAAAQMTIAADGKPVAEFSDRRKPGGEPSGVAISKSAEVGGMGKTSDTMAGFLGSAITGTMEHSAMMLQKVILKHSPPTWSPKAKQLAEDGLRRCWTAQEPNISKEDLDAKVAAQLEEVLREAHVFRTMAYEYDRATSVGLVDTSHPNVGVAAAMVAQQLIWDEHGKSPDTSLASLRLDSGNLLAQGLQFRRVMNEAGMGHMKVIATDGLNPEQVRFFEKIEDEVQKAKDGKLPPSFYELLANAPKAAVKKEEDRAQIKEMAERLVASGGLKEGQSIFAAYGAGEKIGDSVATIGAPSIIFKAAMIEWTKPDGTKMVENLGKLAEPEKSTGPVRELYAKIGPDGKIQEMVIASPNEKLPAGTYQRLMRTIFEDGQVKANLSHKKAVEHGAARRAQLPTSVREGGKLPLKMTQAYKDEWLQLVRETDSTRVKEYREFIDSSWPTAVTA